MADLRWHELMTKVNRRYRRVKHRKDHIGEVPRFDKIVLEYTNLLTRYQNLFLNAAQNEDTLVMYAVVDNAEIDLDNKIDELQIQLADYVRMRWRDFTATLNRHFKQLKIRKENVGDVPGFDAKAEEYVKVLTIYQKLYVDTIDLGDIIALNAVVDNAEMDLTNKINELTELLP